MANMIVGAVVMCFGILIGASLNAAATKAAKKNDNDI